MINGAIVKGIDEAKLQSIDFSIRKGELIGLIGANGAGKSTTIPIATKILLQLIQSEKENGAGILMSTHVLDTRAKQKMGWLFTLFTACLLLVVLLLSVYFFLKGESS